MKRIGLALMLLINALAFCQSHELGLALGGSNYIGDVGSGKYIAPNDLAFGALYRLNRSPRHSYRLSYMHYNINASDADSEVVSIKERGKEFENSINEIGLGIEFSFWDFNLHDDKDKFTPYLYSGIHYASFKKLYFIGKELNEENGSKSTVAIPITVGFKYRIADKLILSAEISAKKTFTDNLDGSNPDDEGGFRSFGNIYNKDWYVFSGVMLTYTFGKQPCFCNF